MDNNLLYAAILTILYFTRAIFLSLDGRSSSFLWISAFFVYAPFQFSKTISNYNPNLVFGTLGTTVVITIPMVMALFILIVVKWRKHQAIAKVKVYFVPVVFGLILMSLVNPYNFSTLGTFIFLLFFSSNIFLFYLFSNFISPKQIIKGVFDAMLFICAADLVLAICFPVLRMLSVTSLFHSTAEAWATREGTRDGAVGLFSHPGDLALFTIISSCFLLSCYLTSYRKLLSLGLLCVNVITLVLTYSRTGYVCFVVVLFFIAYVYRNASKNIFSPVRIFKFVLPAALLLYWVVFLSPFSDIFLDSDADAQYGNRMVHYLMAYDIFQRSPVIGVGLNAHLAFIATQSAITSLDITQSQFFVSNPIHNIHLIVLAETGLVGFILWWLFLFRTIGKAKKQLEIQNQQIISLTVIGIITCYCIYGMSGWAPFTYGILPIFLFFVYFLNKLRVMPGSYKDVPDEEDEEDGEDDEEQLPGTHELMLNNGA